MQGNQFVATAPPPYDFENDVDDDLILRQSEPNSADDEPTSCPPCFCPKNWKILILGATLLILCTWLTFTSVQLMNLNNKIAVIENRPSSVNKTLSDMQGQLDELKKATNQLESEVENLQGYAFKSVSDLESKYSKMEQQIQDLKNCSNSVLGFSVLFSVVFTITVSKVISFQSINAI